MGASVTIVQANGTATFHAPPTTPQVRTTRQPPGNATFAFITALYHGTLHERRADTACQHHDGGAASEWRRNAHRPNTHATAPTAAMDIHVGIDGPGP